MTDDTKPDDPQATVSAPAESVETAADVARRIMANNPQFREAPNTGKAFIVVGARRPK